MVFLEGVAVAASLITACLIYAGGIGLLAGLTRCDWRLRVATVIALLSPLLVLRAFEIFWTLGLQILLVAIQVRAIKRRFGNTGLANDGRLLSGQPERLRTQLWHISPLMFSARHGGQLRSVPAGQQPDASGTTKRFSIATILFITALIAGMIMVLKATLALDAQTWFSQALIAAAASWCTVLAWLVVNLRWLPRAKWLLAVGVTCLLAVPVAWFDELLPSLALPFLSWPLLSDLIDLVNLSFGKVALILCWCAITTSLMLYTALMLQLGRGDEVTRKTSWFFVVALMSPVLALHGTTAFQMILLHPRAPTADAAHRRYERVIELSTRIEASSLLADWTK